MVVSPPMLAAFIRDIFPDLQKAEVAVVLQHLGQISGLVRMFDQLPTRYLPTDERLGEMIGTVETIRYQLQRGVTNNSSGGLAAIKDALISLEGLLNGLPAQLPAIADSLAFVTDPEMKASIAEDIDAVDKSMSASDWKGATVIAGSCVEALLLYGLQQRESKSPGSIKAAVAAIAWKGKMPDASDLNHRSWDLYSYAAVALECKLITQNTEQVIDAIRDFRNLIHPAKARRQKMAATRGTAQTGTAAISLSLEDLRKSL